MPLRALEPESSASANSATAAGIDNNIVAGAAGLEPTNDGVKVRCLTDLATPQYFSISI
jgi:hypothetical protein